MFKRTISAALIFGAAALAPPANAQAVQNCMARANLVEALASKYKEGLVGGGLQNEQQLLEVWSSDETGSFTVLVTRPDGISCIVAAGRNWVAPVLQDDPGGIAG